MKIAILFSIMSFMALPAIGKMTCDLKIYKMDEVVAERSGFEISTVGGGLSFSVGGHGINISTGVSMDSPEASKTEDYISITLTNWGWGRSAASFPKGPFTLETGNSTYEAPNAVLRCK